MTVTVRVEGRDDRHSIACTPPPPTYRLLFRLGGEVQGSFKHTVRPYLYVGSAVHEEEQHKGSLTGYSVSSQVWRQSGH